MRSGWMRWIRSATAWGGALMGGLWALGAGAAEVRNVTAKYAWPWGVGIGYEVVGNVSDDMPVTITATDRANNATYTATASALSGDTGTQTGVHNVLWELDKQGIKLQSTNVVFTVIYEPLYCVVDLSGGTNASSYSVSYMDEPPEGGFNTDEYKTTKLVLRRIEAGTFTMGSPTDEGGRSDDETQHEVTISNPFYMGLFEVTQKQWTLVMGSNPSSFSGDKRPVEQVSWNAIRGNSDTYDWPGSLAVDADSFIGRLQKRTGVAFDLPTEVQWEYACRAGTTTAYSYGDSANGEYMWFYGSTQTHDVGTKKANPWGFYDMHGNVWEWCLDLMTHPAGAAYGWGRVIRGGGWGYDNHWIVYDYAQCRSANRGYSYPSNTSSGLGFRLSRILSE